MLLSHTDAGSTFTKAAEVQIKLDSKHEAATQYINASNCFKKNDPRGYVLILPCCSRDIKIAPKRRSIFYHSNALSTMFTYIYINNVTYV